MCAIGSCFAFLVALRTNAADFFPLALGRPPEAKAIYPKHSSFGDWRERMEELPAVNKLRAALSDPRKQLGRVFRKRGPGAPSLLRLE